MGGMQSAKMDNERGLIWAIVRSGDVRTAIDRKVTSEFFRDDTSARVYDRIVEYWKTYRTAPTAEVLKKDFPTYRAYEGEESYEYHLDEVCRARKVRLTRRNVSQIGHLVEEGSYDDAINLMSVAPVQIRMETVQATDVDITKTGERWWGYYTDLRKNRGVMRGIPTGFKTLDALTSGFLVGQLITLVGEPKSGKSAIAMLMALAAQRAAYPVLFMGFEMSEEEQVARYHAFCAGIDHRKMLDGSLGVNERKILKRTVMHPLSTPFVFSTDTVGSSTVSAVAAKIEEHDPALVVLDGTYFMDDEMGETKGSAQALTNITRSLKQLAMRTQKTILCTTQVLTWKLHRAKGIDLNAIGYSSSFAQDSDLILGVENTEKPEIKDLVVVAARSAAKPAMPMKLSWDWTTARFEELENPDDEYTEQEYTEQEYTEYDEEDDDARPYRSRFGASGSRDRKVVRGRRRGMGSVSRTSGDDGED